jgi:hypothetical protein
MNAENRSAKKRLKKPKHAGGRPPNDSEKGMKGYTVAFRTWEPMYEALRKSAEAAKWSMSAEIEHRIKSSFQYEDDLRHVLAYGTDSGTPALLRLILSAIAVVETQLSGNPPTFEIKQWNKNPETISIDLFNVLLPLMYWVLVEGLAALKGHAAYEEYAKEMLAMMQTVEKGREVFDQDHQREIRGRITAWSVLTAAGFIPRGAAADSERRDNAVTKFKTGTRLADYVRAYPENEFFPSRLTRALESLVGHVHPDEARKHLELLRDRGIKMAADAEVALERLAHGKATASGEKLFARLSEIIDKAKRVTVEPVETMTSEPRPADRTGRSKSTSR